MVDMYDRFTVRFTLIPANGNYPRQAGKWYYSDGTPKPVGPPTVELTGIPLAAMEGENDWVFPKVEQEYAELVNYSRSEVFCIV